MKISLKSQTNSNLVSFGASNENFHAAEIYKKCLVFAQNENLLYNNDQFAPNYEELEKQEKVIQKKLSHRTEKKSFRSSFPQSFHFQPKRQVVFSTLTRVYLKKNINLLFPIQDFLFECNKHGNNSAGSRSREYLEILLCVKKLKMFYGYIPLKQLHKILAQAALMPGYFAKNFFSLIEKRLDVVLYRSGFTKTIVAARQACRHSKVLVNSKVCRSPSTLINPGDIISYLPTEKNTTEVKTHSTDFFFFDQLNSTQLNSSSKSLTSRSISLLLLFCGKCVSQSIILNNKMKQQETKNFIQVKHSAMKCVELNTQSNFSTSKQIQYNDAYRNISYIDTTGFFSGDSKKIDSFNYSSFLEKLVKKAPKNAFSKKTSLLFDNLVSFSKQIECASSVLALRFQKKLSMLKNVNINNFASQVASKNRKKMIESIFVENETNESKIKTPIQGRKFLLTPIHLEISRITNTIIFLYSPQRLYLPFHLDIDILRKSMQK